MDFVYEADLINRGYKMIAGIDEAGRGPLAGPVFAAAVVLPIDFDVIGINDSKQMSPEKRADMYDKIVEGAVSYFVSHLSASVIDKIGILVATKRCMQTAVKNLHVKPNFLLIDGLNLNIPEISQMQIVKGDTKIASIAAASILAKVDRDRYMCKLHSKYPQYNFRSHKGYGTKEHLDAIDKYGPCKEHRMTFAPVKGSRDEGSGIRDQGQGIRDQRTGG